MRVASSFCISSPWSFPVALPIVLSCWLPVKAQESFSSLRLSSNALSSGLGGVNVSLADRNVGLFGNNPALNSDSLNGWAEASYLFYFAHVGMANVALQTQLGKLGSIALGVQHLSLGSIDGYDWVGQPLGTFRSGETTVTIGKSHQVQQFRLGINARFISSQIAGFRATAIAVDFGGLYLHPNQRFVVGLVFKNIGLVVADYTSASESHLPFDIQAGLTVKPEHMPVRFSVTGHRLTKFKTAYESTRMNFDKPSTLDRVVSHLNLAVEALVHRNVSLLLGYQFLRHQELAFDNAGGGSGVSIGALVSVKQTQFVFSRVGYATGGSYQVSISNNLSRLF